MCFPSVCNDDDDDDVDVDVDGVDGLDGVAARLH